MRRFTIFFLTILFPLLLLGGGIKKFARLEDHRTDGDAGTAPISNGSGHVTMTAIATQAELDAISTWPDGYRGEALFLKTIGYWNWTQDIATGGDGFYAIPNVWNPATKIDALDHWQVYPMGIEAATAGEGGAAVDYSNDWKDDDSVCWLPPFTHIVWIKKHCSGSAGALTTQIGNRCTVDGDCVGATTCLDPDHDWSTDPDEITITGHDFGSAGTVFPYPMGYVRGRNNAPVSGYDQGIGNAKEYPTCDVAMNDDKDYWVEVIDANTIKLCVDDGDLEEDCGVTDPYMDCTSDGGDWQALTLYPKNKDGTDWTRIFDAELNQNIRLVDAAAPPAAGTNIAILLAQGRYEAVDPTDSTCRVGQFGNMSILQTTDSSLWTGQNFSSTVEMYPGECLMAIGYVGPVGEWDTLEDATATLSITEAQQASPKRMVFEYSSNSSVPASAMYFSLITDEGAGGNVTLDLDPMVEGMNFCVINTSGNTLNINPDDADQFLYVTSAVGDSLESSTENQAFCAQVISDSEARVLYNNGFTDAD